MKAEQRWRARYFMSLGLMMGLSLAGWFRDRPVVLALIVSGLFVLWVVSTFKLAQLEEPATSSGTMDASQENK